MKAFTSYFKPGLEEGKEAESGSGSGSGSALRQHHRHKREASSLSTSEKQSSGVRQHSRKRHHGHHSSLLSSSSIPPLTTTATAAAAHPALPLRGSMATPTLPSTTTSRPASVHTPYSSFYQPWTAGGIPVSAALSAPGSNRGESVRSSAMTEMKTDMTCSWVYNQLLQKQWLSGCSPDEGVVMKKGPGEYASYPPELRDMREGLFDHVGAINARCAMAVSIRVITVFVSAFAGATDHIPLPDGLRLQIIPSLSNLAHCKKHHLAAFVEDAGIMVIWDDDPKTMISRTEELEASFIKFMWGPVDMAIDEEDDEDDGGLKKETGGGVGGGVGGDVFGDEEKGVEEERRHLLMNPFIVACTLALMLSCLGFGARALALQVRVDGSYLRLLILVVMPLQMFAALFFFQTIIVNICMLLGPISPLTSNSKHYSGRPPRRRLEADSADLPHVTIQMPVYKETIAGVIRPTVNSLKQAMRTYELQGGTANIFVNDDGMQTASPEQGEARREFYRENHIGWVARPPHNTNPDKGPVFVRQGKFKKASNMNYALMISNQVEERLGLVERGPGWSNAREAVEYERCLGEVLAEHEGRAWADGNIRLGDYILIIDSDTRVPADCLLDAVTEMEQSPEVAIMQFTSGVMQVTTSYFENGITFFTNLVYSAITYAVANGDSVPFVGHNAMLRWSALQDGAAWIDESDGGQEKFWSDSHVSEDFDMSLRLQCAGYQMRFAAYTGISSGFKEGVSLTVNDELARWEKYAFGCSELIFHPLKDWLFRGPITPLFRRFLLSRIHLPKKITILAYIGTYYALGATWLLTLMNYFLVGWFLGHYDKYYLDSFKIWIAIVVVFTGMGNFCLGVMRYRLGEKSLISALWETFRWIPLLAIFLGGISLHISQALLSHLFSIPMNWGATAKEYVDVDFVSELPKLLKSYKGTFTFVVATAATMLCLAFAVPHHWQIRDFIAVFPLSFMLGMHFLLPVALHPALMKFTW